MFAANVEIHAQQPQQCLLTPQSGMLQLARDCVPSKSNPNPNLGHSENAYALTVIPCLGCTNNSITKKLACRTTKIHPVTKCRLHREILTRRTIFLAPVAPLKMPRGFLSSLLQYLVH